MNKKRKQIINAAHQLFIDKGYALTSIQDILDKSGVAKGTFYNYFNSKNECLRAILESITEEVDQRRREIALGNEHNNEDVFVEQLAVRMNMNRQHHLLTVFESVSFSEDVELKSFMVEQYRNELLWITNRLSDLYPPEAKTFTLDHAVMLIGIVHHMMHVWMLGQTKEIPTKRIIRYALTRVKSMLNGRLENEEAFLPENWLDFTNENVAPDLDIVLKQLEQLSSKLKGKATSKQNDLVQFLFDEFQEKSPRTFLLESVLISIEQAFEQTELEHEVRQIVKIAWQII